MNNPTFTPAAGMPMQFPMMQPNPYPTYPAPTPYQAPSVSQNMIKSILEAVTRENHLRNDRAD